MWFGRKGLRLANTPTRLLPPSRGGRTVGENVSPSRTAAENCQRSQIWENSSNPRPSYQDDPERVYGFGFAGMEVRFRASNGVLTVLDIQKEE